SPTSGATPPTTPTSSRSISAPSVASSKRTAPVSSTQSVASVTGSTRYEDRLAPRSRHPHHPRRARDRAGRRGDRGHTRLPRQARRRPPHEAGRGRRVCPARRLRGTGKATPTGPRARRDRHPYHAPAPAGTPAEHSGEVPDDPGARTIAHAPRGSPRRHHSLL